NSVFIDGVCVGCTNSLDLGALIGNPLDSILGPNTPPNPPPPQKLSSRLVCAANYGDNHSLAAATGATSPTGKFISNLFLGNSVSGIVEIGNDIFGNGTPTGQQAATVLLSGGGQGIPGGGPGMKGPAGMIQDAAVGEVATQLLGEGAADAVANVVGLAKFGYDLGSFLWGLHKCK
ncbi:MAG: hypothetical protein WBE88_14060, partial [Candidatus Acidiferrales bacterium]